MSYNLLNPVHIIIAGDMSGNLTSPAVEVKLQDNIGIQMNWTGAPVGTFSFQISMDHKEDIEGNIVTAGNWITLPVQPAIVATGTPDVAYVDLNQQSAMYMRVVYSYISGSGTLNVFVDAKGI